MARILVVEDEADIRDVIAFNLRQAGHQVLTAGRGSEALEALDAHKPGLVILDLMLPDMAGTEICKTIKHDPRTKHIPVVMLTHEARERDMRAALAKIDRLRDVAAATTMIRVEGSPA